MVNVKVKGVHYSYPNKKLENFIIEKKLSEEFSAFIKKNRLVKSKILSDFYRSILIMDKLGRLKKENYVVSTVIK